jgi:hypothetical protein
MPFVLAVPALFLGCQALADEEPVQSRKPEVIVVKTVIERGTGADFLRQGFGPLFPGEEALVAERKGHGKGLGLPGRGEDGTLLILRQAWQAFSLMALQDRAPTDRD